MHKILICKAGQANGGTGVPFNMKVVKFREHVVSRTAKFITSLVGCIISLYNSRFVYYRLILRASYLSMPGLIVT